jgi:hypothetical protein
MKDEMDDVCSAHGGGEKCVLNFDWRHSSEEAIRKTSAYVDNIKMDVRVVKFGGMDCIHLAQDMDW